MVCHSEHNLVGVLHQPDQGRLALRVDVNVGQALLHNPVKRQLDINGQTAHAHVANSGHNFDYVPGKEIVTSYFDFEDDEWVKVDLWICAKAGLNAINLILAVQRDFGGFIPKSEVDGLGGLMADNDDVLKEIEADRRTPADSGD